MRLGLTGDMTCAGSCAASAAAHSLDMRGDASKAVNHSAYLLSLVHRLRRDESLADVVLLVKAQGNENHVHRCVISLPCARVACLRSLEGYRRLSSQLEGGGGGRRAVFEPTYYVCTGISISRTMALSRSYASLFLPCNKRRREETDVTFRIA